MHLQISALWWCCSVITCTRTHNLLSISLSQVIFLLVSISSTFFLRVFCTKDNCATFSSYVLALAKGFWWKKALLYEICARKMLMKLMADVRLIPFGQICNFITNLNFKVYFSSCLLQKKYLGKNQHIFPPLFLLWRPFEKAIYNQSNCNFANPI